MTPREEVLLIELRQLIVRDVENELIQLKRKVRSLERQRDEWREAAQRYRKQLVEYKRDQRL